MPWQNFLITIMNNNKKKKKNQNESHNSKKCKNSFNSEIDQFRKFVMRLMVRTTRTFPHELLRSTFCVAWYFHKTCHSISRFAFRKCFSWVVVVGNCCPFRGVHDAVWSWNTRKNPLTLRVNNLIKFQFVLNLKKRYAQTYKV